MGREECMFFKMKSTRNYVCIYFTGDKESRLQRKFCEKHCNCEKRKKFLKKVII